MTAVPATRTVHEQRFPAMGSDMHVIVVGGSPELVATAHARIDELEARWSRFRPDSELARINRAAGRPVRVSADTAAAVTAAVDGWRETDGAFDPTVLAALVGAGYDRDFATLGPATDPARTAAVPGCAGIVVDPLVPSVTIPAGTTVDLGGIGKGLAADLVVDLLCEAGAEGACVNAGGDLRCRGDAPTDDGWVVDLGHLPGMLLALGEGAVATTSSERRRWTRAAVEQHHVIDPRTGAPTDSGLRAVTIVAATAATAEVLAKAAFVAGPEEAPAIVGRSGATGLLVTTAGTTLRLPGIEEYLR